MTLLLSISGISHTERGLRFCTRCTPLDLLLSFGSSDLDMFKTSSFLDEFWIGTCSYSESQSSTLSDHITSRHLKAPADFDLAPLHANLDIRFRATGQSPPSVVILDYIEKLRQTNFDGLAKQSGYKAGPETTSILIEQPPTSIQTRMGWRTGPELSSKSTFFLLLNVER